MASLNVEQRDAMSKRHTTLSPEMRAQSAGTGSAGGFTVPEGFEASVAIALKDFGGMRQARTNQLSTASGQDIPWPTSDDTSNSGALLGENTQDTEQDIVFGETVLKSYTYTSKIVRVSLQLIQDEAVNLPQLLARMLGERIGRITNLHYTTGDNASKPQGVITSANVGKTAASATAIAADEVFDLQHALDPAYRQDAEWMCNDSTLKAVRLLKDTTNQYLFQPGLQAGVPDSILGRPFIINQDVASIATTNKTLAFGDFSQYVIRDVKGLTLLRLEERYADFLQVGFIAYLRTDGRLVAGATGAQNPIQVLQQA